MKNEKFENLMCNCKNYAPCDLKPLKDVLYNAAMEMNEKQIKTFAELLVSKGVAYRERGNVFIYGVKECIY